MQRESDFEGREFFFLKIPSSSLESTGVSLSYVFCNIPKAIRPTDNALKLTRN